MKRLLPIFLLFLLSVSTVFALPTNNSWYISGNNLVINDSNITGICQSNGTTCSTIGAAAGANTALSNLSSVAINTSLLSDTADTDSLGSTSKEWLSAYLGDAGKLYFGLGQDASINRSAANELTLTATSGVKTSNGLTVGGTLTLGSNDITLTG